MTADDMATSSTSGTTGASASDAHAAPARASRRSGARRRIIGWLLAGSVAVVVATGAVLGASWWSAPPTIDPNTPIFEVAQGPLTISVTESGTVTAREQVVIKSQVEGQPTIIYLIEEGRHVEKGDLLVQLDSSELESDLLDQEIKVQNAKAKLIQAKEFLAVAQNQAIADIAEAELTYQFAQEDLKKYIDGEYPVELMKAKAQIALAEAELEQATETLEWSKKLHAGKYISDNELDGDRIAHDKAKLELKVAREELALLEDWTYQRKVAQLKSDAEQARMALDRTRRSAKADMVEAESSLRAKQLEFTRQSDRFGKIKDQIAKCKITAPTSGMVVYATTGRSRRNDEPLQEGQQVRERQELIHLPTASSMQAEVKVHESSLQMVEVGQPVRVTIDALPGRTFTGRVTKIAPLPDQQSAWLNPDLKVYSTEIALDGILEDVRTGMSCRAEILVDYYPQTVYLPMQAVVRVGSQPTVYVRSVGGFNPRPVTLGLNNNRMVRVIEGIEPGQVVSLTPPLAPAAMEPSMGFAKLLAEQPQSAPDQDDDAPREEAVPTDDGAAEAGSLAKRADPSPAKGAAQP